MFLILVGMAYPVISAEEAATAARYLSEQDPILAPVIKRVGLCTIRPHKDYYRELVQSILGQQLSLKSAAAIEARFVALFDGTFPTPDQILSLDIEQMREVGLSRPKAAYIQDLADKVLSGDVRFEHLDELSNEQIVAELTAVKGIGEWTVHMFLMFCMGRMNVLPTGDLGIRNGITKLYGLKTAATPLDVQNTAQTYNWQPYESIASWYVWKSLE